MWFVGPSCKVDKVMSAKSGRRPYIWALEWSSNEEVAKCLRLHFKLLSPKFQVAETVAQTILDEYITKRKMDEISYREIVVQVKALRVPFRTPDIADLAATYLNERGIKVWR